MMMSKNPVTNYARSFFGAPRTQKRFLVEQKKVCFGIRGWVRFIPTKSTSKAGCPVAQKSYLRIFNAKDVLVLQSKIKLPKILRSS